MPGNCRCCVCGCDNTHIPVKLVTMRVVYGYLIQEWLCVACLVWSWVYPSELLTARQRHGRIGY